MRWKYNMLEYYKRVDKMKENYQLAPDEGLLIYKSAVACHNRISVDDCMHAYGFANERKMANYKYAELSKTSRYVTEWPMPYVNDGKAAEDDTTTA